MRPISFLYDRAMEAWAARYADGRAASERLSRPTVSVGNITLGGTGKTPFILFLAERFLADGRRPAILSRGYGRRSKDVVVVSSGAGPLVSPDEGGDEPVLLAQRLPGAIVVAAPRRSDAARAADHFSPDLFLLDDGFQHLAVRRDLDIVLLDARDPFGGGRYPPAGRLREPPSALRRADAAVFTRAGGGFPSAQAAEAVRRRHAGLPLFTAHTRSVIVQPAAAARPGARSAGPLAGGALLAVCGIARPDSFAASLAELSISPVKTLVFPDHCRYGPRELSRIRRAAARAGCSAVVTTEKDAVKLSGKIDLPLLLVRLEVDVVEPSFLTFVSEAIAAAASKTSAASSSGGRS